MTEPGILRTTALTFQLVQGELAHCEMQNPPLPSNLLKINPFHPSPSSSSPSFHICNIAMSDTAEKMQQRFQAQYQLSKAASQNAAIFCTRGVKILLKKRKFGGQKMVPRHIFCAQGVHMHLLISRLQQREQFELCIE